ncbi:MAG: helix-turn-helix domain-containing protein [Candidatus Niameybacter stercoravium]|jgi:transcriptional regulator with XRE-family HTH domain|nr:helix-turn-helix domain-containing protein [Candidatus Niameybacter stercoravium]
MTFGERLRSLREENDVTQADIATLLNISARMVSFYENDKHFLRDADSLIKLAKYFNVTTDYLLGLSNTKDPYKNSQIITTYNALPTAGQASMDEFLSFLASKYKCK